MAVSLRPCLGALAVVALGALTQPRSPAVAQVGPPPPPPPARPAAARLPLNGDQQPPPPPVADLTPPEFVQPPLPPTTITCDGCRACDSPAAWLFSAEYLLVRPRRRADDFAIVDPLDNLTPEGDIRSVGYDLSSGLRAGVGYRMAGTPWEEWFTYTYLHAGGDRTAIAPPGGLIYPTLTRPGLVDTADAAVARNSLNYNLYDLDAVRRVAGDESLALRLGFGFRYASIDQTQSASYFGRDANAAAVNSRVSFDGAGPTVLGEGRWLMPWGLSTFGRVRGGLIVGDTTNSLRETDNGGTTVSANVREHYYTTIPVLEMATGVAWEYRNVRIAAGYEVTNWFNMVDSPTFVNDFAEGKLGRRRGDLSLEGLFLQLGVTY
ncbi:MAG TPA: Lpg1974 family pore-forming outer membrane protein [Gemmataceae bacterium]|jgi:hypothetical protein